MNVRLEAWDPFVRELIAQADRLASELGTPEFWIKESDGAVVSELDVRIDLAVRMSFARHFPGARLLSEELGWMRSASGPRLPEVVGVLDPIDGTESLASGRPTWWVSFAMFVDRSPLAGLLHQPRSGVTFDSTSVCRVDATRPRTVGLSPDQLDESSAFVRALERGGFTPVPEPHAAQKIAAVLAGRCSSVVYVPSAKSPTWRSWDLAAGIVLSREAGLILTTGTGDPLKLDDLNEARGDPWICASGAEEHEELVSVLARV